MINMTSADAALLEIESALDEYDGDILGDLNDAAAAELGYHAGVAVPSEVLVRWIVMRALGRKP